MKIKAEALLLIRNDDNEIIRLKVDITKPQYRALLKDIKNTIARLNDRPRVQDNH